MSYGKRVTKEKKGREARNAAAQRRQVQKGLVEGVADSAIREALTKPMSAQRIADLIVGVHPGLRSTSSLHRSSTTTTNADSHSVDTTVREGKAASHRTPLSLDDVEIPEEVLALRGNLAKNVTRVAAQLVASGQDVSFMEDVALGSGAREVFRRAAVSASRRAHLGLERQILARVDRQWAEAHDLDPRDIAESFATQLVAGAALVIAASSNIATAQRAIKGHAVRKALSQVLDHAKRELVTGLQPMRVSVTLTVEPLSIRTESPSKSANAAPEHGKPQVDQTTEPHLRLVQDPKVLTTSGQASKGGTVELKVKPRVARDRVFAEVRGRATKLGPLSPEVPSLLKALVAEAQDPRGTTPDVLRKMAERMTQPKHMGDGIGSQTKLTWGKLQGVLVRQANTLEANPQSSRVAVAIATAVECLEVAGGFSLPESSRALF